MAFPTPTSSSSNNHNFDGLSSSSTGDFSAVPSPSNTSQNQYQQWLGGSSRKPQQFDALSSRPDLLSFHSLLEPDAGALRLDDVGSGGLIPIDSVKLLSLCSASLSLISARPTSMRTRPQPHCLLQEPRLNSPSVLNLGPIDAILLTNRCRTRRLLRLILPPCLHQCIVPP